MESNLQIIAQSDDQRSATFAVLLPKGMGGSLGNSLRRILIDSIAGVAVTRASFEGVFSGYGTIPGVSEDTRDIQANLKTARFRMEPGIEQVTIAFTTKKPGVVTVGDLELPEGVTASEPSHKIFTLDPSAAKPVVMTLTLQRGVGYMDADSFRTENVEEIPFDAHFSPVRRCNDTVKEARADQGRVETLEIEVETDGTRTPEECLREAAALLQAEAARITGDPAEVLAHLPVQTQEVVPTKAVKAVPDEQITSLGLTPRLFNTLRRRSVGGKPTPIETIPQLLEIDVRELMAIRNFGKTSLIEIYDALVKHGYGEQVASWEAVLPAKEADVDVEEEAVPVLEA